jgi:hypothetical protein
LPDLIVYKSATVFFLLLGLFVAERYFPSAVMPEQVKTNHRKVKNL